MNSSAVKRHHLGPLRVPVVLPAEADLSVGESDEPAVGDGDPVGVAAEIVEHLLRAAERALGVDHPVDLAQGRRCAAKAAGLASPASSPKKPSRPASNAACRRSRNSRR